MSQPQGTKVTFDHRTIKQWSEERKAQPVKIKTVDEPIEALKVEFPEEHRKHKDGTKEIAHLTWEQFFKEFESENLAFQFLDEDVDGKKSRFYRVIYR